MYSPSRQFTKNKEIIQNFKETGDSRYIYQNELDKAYFQKDMAYDDFEDLSRRTASDKILQDSLFKITNRPKYDGYPRGLNSIIYKCFDKKSAGGAITNEIASIQQLTGELHKQITENFQKRKVY